MRLTFLGTGTSHGIPVIGCHCPVCHSPDPRDTRFRSSVYIEGTAGEAILIDAGPEFRLQALRVGIERLDAVLLTHPHADHIHGLDDLRPLSREKALPLYGNSATLDEVAERFSYVFRETQVGGGKPRFNLVPLESPVHIGGLCVTPIPVKHGALDILGFRIDEEGRSLAYISDASLIEESSLNLLSNLDLLVLNALRRKAHETHLSFDGARTIIGALKPSRGYLTHLCHEHSHAEVEAEFADCSCVKPAFDTLSLTV